MRHASHTYRDPIEVQTFAQYTENATVFICEMDCLFTGEIYVHEHVSPRPT